MISYLQFCLHLKGEDVISYVRPSGKDFEPRAPRGPSGGRGFVGREALRERALAEKLSKETREPIGLSNGHSRINGPMRPQDLSRANRREGNYKSHFLCIFF